MLKHAQRSIMMDQGHIVPEHRPRVHGLLPPKHQDCCPTKISMLATKACCLRTVQCCAYDHLEGWLARQEELTDSLSDLLYHTSPSSKTGSCFSETQCWGSASLRSLRLSRCPGRAPQAALSFPSSSGLLCMRQHSPFLHPGSVVSA